MDTMNDQPLPADDPRAISCGNCRFALPMYMSRTDLTATLVCKRFPPTPAFFPTREGPSILPNFPCAQPPVSPANWCAEFQPALRTEDGKILNEPAGKLVNFDPRPKLVS